MNQTVPAGLSGPATALDPRTALFAALFVLSGAAGLTYEVVWSRLLVDVFGVTAFAVSTVLVSFMGGMALGAAVVGRRIGTARRPLRWFALFEAGIALYALVLPWLLDGVDVVYGGVVDWLPDAVLARSLVRFVLCVVVLAVPTVLMGGTLPALGQGLLRRRRKIGAGVAILYFVNTLGAGLGCYFAGFALIPSLGLRGTTLLAAAVNGAIAVTAWLLDRGVSEGTVTVDPDVAPDSPMIATTPASWPLIVAFGSGAAALMFEVVWFRVLVLVFGSTVYSFSSMLAVFLIGLAIGSILLGPLADRARHPVRLLALTQGAVALFALLGGIAVHAMPEAFLGLIREAGLNFDGMNRTKFILSVVTLLPPAIAFGGTFPVVVRLYRAGDASAGSRIGRVYAWNTVGAILGSFGAGFLLLPTIGSEWTLKLVVVVSLTLAFGSLLAEAGPLRLRWALPAGLGVIAMATVLVLAPPWNRTVLGAGLYFEPTQFFNSDGEIDIPQVVAHYDLMTFTEGFNDTIISYRSPKGKFITVNGSTTASDQLEDMFAQRMLGHLPMALHPGEPRTALMIGLGSGVTAGAIGLYEIDELVAVELERGVFDASRFFEQENHHVLDNDRVTIRIDDGRNYLKRSDRRFDVISSDPNFPSLTGSGTLFSVEYFQLARSHLAENGIMCQWAPIWRLRPSELAGIMRSFAEVFPHVRVFSVGFRVVLLGRVDPFPPVDLDELTSRVSRPPVAESLAGIGVRGPIELLSFYQFDRAELLRWTADARLNTDDHPHVEFDAPRGLFSDTVGTNLAALRSVRPAITERASRLGIQDESYRSSFEALAAAYEATTDAEIAMERGETAEALALAIPAALSGQRFASLVVASYFEREGKARQQASQLEGALESYRRALDFEPDRLDALLGVGSVAMFLGRLDEAEAALEAATSQFPRSGSACERLGLVRELQGRADEAEALYRRAIELQPMLSKPYVLLGRLQLLSARPNLAIENFQEARRRGDRSEGACLGLGAALLSAGRQQDAIDTARDCVKRFQDSGAAAELLASTLEQAGRDAEAEEVRRGAPRP